MPIRRALVLLLLLAACREKPSSQQTQAPPQQTSAPQGTPLDAFRPLPAAAPANEAQLLLGRTLFFDQRLSRGQRSSCASCHAPESAGADTRPTEPLLSDATTRRNAPTVLNAGLNRVYGWDGRTDLLEEYLTWHLAGAATAQTDEVLLPLVLGSMPEYGTLFQQAFPTESQRGSYAQAVRALALYVRQLVTPGRFERFLGGESGALSDAEKQGLRLFVSTGCTQCHAGTNLGGEQARKLGQKSEWEETRDQGRFALTQNEEDMHFFRVAPLRNVARTPPYLHDGSIAQLPEVVERMARHQLGKELPAADVQAIATFLGALSADPPASLFAPPAAFPKATAKTPRP